LHQRRSGFRIAEDQQLGRPQIHADRSRAGGMVDPCEYRDAARRQTRRQPIDGVLDRMGGRDRDQTLVRRRLPPCLTVAKGLTGRRSGRGRS
jgi:hypothetical protein